MMNTKTLVGIGACSAAILSLLCSGGCMTMHPDEDPNRSYFDGGALQEPDPMRKELLKSSEPAALDWR